MLNWLRRLVVAVLQTRADYLHDNRSLREREKEAYGPKP